MTNSEIENINIRLDELIRQAMDARRFFKCGTYLSACADLKMVSAKARDLHDLIDRST